MSTKRDALREQALKSRAPRAQRVTYEGVEYEIRAPTVRARSKILEKAGAYAAMMDKSGKRQADIAASQVAAVIYCTFVPRSSDEELAGAEPERVFDESEFEVLLETEAGGLVDALSPVALQMINVSKDDEKND